jgi:hypothetical protein
MNDLREPEAHCKSSSADICRTKVVTATGSYTDFDELDLLLVYQHGKTKSEPSRPTTYP